MTVLSIPRLIHNDGFPYHDRSGVHVSNDGSLIAVVSMVSGGVSVFGIYLVTSSTANIILSCVFGAVTTMGFNALDCLGVELFPTRLRY